MGNPESDDQSLAGAEIPQDVRDRADAEGSGEPELRTAADVVAQVRSQFAAAGGLRNPGSLAERMKRPVDPWRSIAGQVQAIPASPLPELARQQVRTLEEMLQLTREAKADARAARDDATAARAETARANRRSVFFTVTGLVLAAASLVSGFVSAVR